MILMVGFKFIDSAFEESILWVSLSSNLKLLNQKKEMLEKMNQDLADLIPDKKKNADN